MYRFLWWTWRTGIFAELGGRCASPIVCTRILLPFWQSGSIRAKTQPRKDVSLFIKINLTEGILMRSIADEMGSRFCFDGVHEVRFAAAAGGHVVMSMAGDGMKR